MAFSSAAVKPLARLNLSCWSRGRGRGHGSHSMACCGNIGPFGQRCNLTGDCGQAQRTAMASPGSAEAQEYRGRRIFKRSPCGSAHWLGTQIKQNCPLRSPARWGHGLHSVHGQSGCLGVSLAWLPVGRVPRVRAGCGKPTPVSVSLIPSRWEMNWIPGSLCVWGGGGLYIMSLLRHMSQ